MHRRQSRRKPRVVQGWLDFACRAPARMTSSRDTFDVREQATDTSRVPFANVPYPEKIILYLSAAVLGYFACAGWFDVFQFTVFAGDDLRAFASPAHSIVASIAASVSGLKFRPATSVFTTFCVALTSGNYRGLATVGVMLHTVNAALFLSLLRRHPGVPFACALGLTCIAFFSRFATYLFMQEQALMEGLGIAVLLLILLEVEFYNASPSKRRAVALAVGFLILIHVHERYLVIALPLVLLSVLSFSLHRAASIVLFAGTVGAAGINVGIKKLVLSTPLLIGTTTQPIEFNVRSILTYFWYGTLNLVGINRGPAHLSLEDFTDSPATIKILSLVAATLAFGLLAVVAFWLLKARHNRRSDPTTKLIIVYFAAIVTLLLSSSVTIRQEFRWVFPAYLVFLALLTTGLANVARHNRKWLVYGISLLIFVSIAREVYLRQLASRFYAFEAYQVANNLLHSVNQIADLPAKDRIVIHGTVDASEWIFMGGLFAKKYNLPPIEFEGESATPEIGDDRPLRLQYRPADRSFLLSDRSFPLDNPHDRGVAALELQAVKQRAESGVATPTGTRLFRMAKNGVECVVAVSPIEVYVPVSTPRTLRVTFSHMYALGDGADLELEAVSPAGMRELLSKRVPPLANDDQAVWRTYEFPLSPDIQQILIKVVSRSDPTADWIAFREFSIN